jgi:hypothetical protein
MVRSTPKFLKSRHNQFMAGRECHHCKQWIEPGEAHDCRSTTEAASDARPAGESAGRVGAAARNSDRVRPAADLRLRSCDHVSRERLLLLRSPRKQYLEVCVFLGRRIEATQVRRVEQPSKSNSLTLSGSRIGTRWNPGHGLAAGGVPSVDSLSKRNFGAPV